MSCPTQWNSDIRVDGIMEGFVPSIRGKCGDIICNVLISEVDDKIGVDVGNPLVKPKVQEGEECHHEL